MTTEKTESADYEEDDCQDICDYRESLAKLVEHWNNTDLNKPSSSISLSEATERAKTYKERLERGECQEELLFMENALDHRYENGYVKNTPDNAEEFDYKPAEVSEKVLAARKYVDFIRAKEDYNPQALCEDLDRLEEIIGSRMLRKQ